MNIRYGNTYELIQLSAIGTNCTRRKISRSMGPWNKPERRYLARGFMPRKPVDRRRAEWDSSGLPSGNIDLKQRKDWSIWADKMISSRGIYNNGTPVLRIPNIGEGVIDFSDLKYMQGELGNSYHEVFENDILIIRSNGSRDLVGKCAIVPALERRYAYASFLIRIKASDKVLPKYLVRYINSSMARGQLFAKAKSSSGIHNINSKELGSIRIDVPTIEEQTEILKIIEPLIKKELDVKDITSNMIENIAELKKSILAKAFRGELGTNVSSEENSIELIKKMIGRDKIERKD